MFWKCANKEKESIEEDKDTSVIDHTTTTTPTVLETFKYELERVHVDVDFMVEGSDKGNWDDIWYVSSAYKKHMCPMKHLFKRMI